MLNTQTKTTKFIANLTIGDVALMGASCTAICTDTEEVIFDDENRPIESLVLLRKTELVIECPIKPEALARLKELFGLIVPITIENMMEGKAKIIGIDVDAIDGNVTIWLELSPNKPVQWG